MSGESLSENLKTTITVTNTGFLKEKAKKLFNGKPLLLKEMNSQPVGRVPLVLYRGYAPELTRLVRRVARHDDKSPPRVLTASVKCCPPLLSPL